MSNLNKASNLLKAGGIVIYPTDTAFGIGCRIDREKSIEKLFKIRKRPQTQATPVLVNSIKMAENYFQSPIPDNVRHMMKDFWPGALTIIYKCKEDLIPPLVRGGGNTIGLRMPNHKITLNLINTVGVPILGPSANFHGDPTPYDFDSLNKELSSLADYVVRGVCLESRASTVIDTSVVPFKIIRQGPLVIPEKYIK
ncbi:threonylcarbamoyl-AMP synthase [Candidatus Gottesmanbacteria bacterium]|nr:threonylcarbamoyl-AMP synthase [Candidatus Gottesmanbacteria bacterium]